MKNMSNSKIIFLFLTYKFPRLVSNVIYLFSLFAFTTIIRFELGFSEMTAVIISLSLWFLDLLIIIFDYLSKPPVEGDAKHKD